MASVKCSRRSGAGHKVPRVADRVSFSVIPTPKGWPINAVAEFVLVRLWFLLPWRDLKQPLVEHLVVGRFLNDKIQAVALRIVAAYGF